MTFERIVTYQNEVQSSIQHFRSKNIFVNQSEQENIDTAKATFISQSEQRQPSANQSKENLHTANQNKEKLHTANQRKDNLHKPIVAKKTFISQS